MPMKPEHERDAVSAPRWQKVGWFIALWLMSVAGLGVVAYGIRLFIK